MRSAVKRAVWKKYGGRCAICGRELVRHESQNPWPFDNEVGHVDHIIPRSKGGADALKNLRLVCKRFNLTRKNNLDGGECHAS